MTKSVQLDDQDDQVRSLEAYPERNKTIETDPIGQNVIGTTQENPPSMIFLELRDFQVCNLNKYEFLCPSATYFWILNKKNVKVSF